MKRCPGPGLRPGAEPGGGRSRGAALADRCQSSGLGRRPRIGEGPGVIGVSERRWLPTPRRARPTTTRARSTATRTAEPTEATALKVREQADLRGALVARPGLPGPKCSRRAAARPRPFQRRTGPLPQGSSERAGLAAGPRPIGLNAGAGSRRPRPSSPRGARPASPGPPPASAAAGPSSSAAGTRPSANAVTPGPPVPATWGPGSSTPDRAPLEVLRGPGTCAQGRPRTLGSPRGRGPGQKTFCRGGSDLGRRGARRSSAGEIVVPAGGCACFYRPRRPRGRSCSTGCRRPPGAWMRSALMGGIGRGGGGGAAPRSSSRSRLSTRLRISKPSPTPSTG